MTSTSGISQCKTSSCQSVSSTSEVSNLLEIHWIFVLQTFKGHMEPLLLFLQVSGVCQLNLSFQFHNGICGEAWKNKTWLVSLTSRSHFCLTPLITPQLIIMLFAPEIQMLWTDRNATEIPEQHSQLP